MSWYRWQGNALILVLRVQPRAREDALGEPFGDALKVRLQAPPVDGKANARLTAFLADLFGVPRRQVSILGGEGARSKILRIDDPRKLPSQIPPRNGAAETTASR
jgi:uncharacterized protein (TIGR00251 family)